MIKKISHIGLAVNDLEEAKTFFNETFSMPSSNRENFGELLFSFIPFEETGTKLELLQSTTPTGQISKFLEKKGQGVHHVALEVDDIQAELDNLKAKGIKLINQEPYLNAHQDQVAFIHPQSTYGILFELIQPKRR
ncbi:MAG: methylmalonyl-CoA epimerase [Proteobacteria bacterium]|nr:methylmalonyl-CoA epimerase [Pseudomonadota bacterium]